MRITYGFSGRSGKRRKRAIKSIISASVLAADPLKIGNDVSTVISAGADWLHLDIMDGHYVPNISYGPALVKSLRTGFQCTLDVHLMISDPDRYISEFAAAGADFISVHPETTLHLHRTLSSIRQLGVRSGVALNPATAPAVLEHILDQVDLVLLMSVNPGFGVQKFIEHTYAKVRAVVDICQQGAVTPLIAVDGGINAEIAVKLRHAGVNVLIAGSALFSAENPREYIRQMRG